MTIPRVAILGAFQFPVPQGSQVFVGEQALALACAGAEPTLVCYGRGVGAAPEGLRVLRIPAALTPRSYRAGPRLRKPVADCALLAALVRAQSARPFDAVLAHNAEAAAIALAAQRVTNVPVVYVAHTLLEVELPVYGPPALAGALCRAGAALDRALARRADAVIALCDGARSRLAPHARGPVEWIPPGLEPRPAPSAAEVAETCQHFGLAPGAYALYAGNPDPYQDLDVLRDAAARIDLPVVVATHAPGARLEPLRVLACRDPESVRRLTFGAALTVAPRRRHGGFPIKLLNYMEASRAIVAREGLVDGLVHDRNAWLVPGDAGPAAFAQAIAALASDPRHASRLGAAARNTLERTHAWPALARRTLDLAVGARQSLASGRASRPVVETSTSHRPGSRAEMKVADP